MAWQEGSIPFFEGVTKVFYEKTEYQRLRETLLRNDLHKNAVRQRGVPQKMDRPIARKPAKHGLLGWGFRSIRRLHRRFPGVLRRNSFRVGCRPLHRNRARRN